MLLAKIIFKEMYLKIFRIITPTNIPYSQNLNVKIRWTNPVALPSTIDGTIRCHLEGFLYRSAQ